jgi:hypothetical protein
MVGFWRKLATEGAKKVKTISSVKPRTTPSHALQKFKARVKGIEKGAAEGTKKYKGDLPKATVEKVEKDVRIKHKTEAGKKLLKENQ